MQKSPGRMWSFYCIAAYSLIATRDAHAYLDPGTGSLLIQILVGAVLGASLTVKMWWYRVKEVVARVIGSSPDDADRPRVDDE